MARLPAGVRLAVARVPTDPLAKGRDHAVAADGLVLAQALGDGHADLAVLHALEPALADGHDARAHLLAHVHLERGALDRGRRRRRLCVKFLRCPRCIFCDGGSSAVCSPARGRKSAAPARPAAAAAPARSVFGRSVWPGLRKFTCSTRVSHRGGRHREQARGLLGVARLEVRVHVRARAEARGDQDAPVLALTVEERAPVLCGWNWGRGERRGLGL